MDFNEESLVPSWQDELVITAVASFTPSPAINVGSERWPSHADHGQLASDCMAAGASMLHVSVLDALTGQGTSDARQISILLAILRHAAPGLLLQIDAPQRSLSHNEASWFASELPSFVENLEIKPDFMTVEVSASMPVLSESAYSSDARRDRRSAAAQFNLLRHNGIQPFFMLHDLKSQNVLEHLVRTGAYMGPVNQCMMAAMGGHIGNNPIDWLEFLRRAPNGSKIAVQGGREVAVPLAAIAIAFGIHVRVVGSGSTQGRQQAEPDLVQRVKQLVRTAQHFDRKVATYDAAIRIMSVGTWFDSSEEALFVLGLQPSRQAGIDRSGSGTQSS